MDKEQRDRQRWQLSDRIRQQVDWRNTDQNRGRPSPPIQKPLPEGAEPIPLPPAETWTGFDGVSLLEAIANRRSRRSFSSASLSLPELSFLLWATQGVSGRAGPQAVLRTVPSAGNRHSLETYLAVMRVDGLAAGLYRYLPLSHELVLLRPDEDLGPDVTRACLGQRFCGEAAVTFVWTTVPGRMEWRYDLAAHRVIPLDAGHVAQNLYLACEAICASTCAVAAYDQDAMDALLGVDGQDEFTLYLAAVGKPA